MSTTSNIKSLIMQQLQPLLGSLAQQQQHQRSSSSTKRCTMTPLPSKKSSQSQKHNKSFSSLSSSTSSTSSSSTVESFTPIPAQLQPQPPKRPPPPPPSLSLPPANSTLTPGGALTACIEKKRTRRHRAQLIITSQQHSKRQKDELITLATFASPASSSLNVINSDSGVETSYMPDKKRATVIVQSTVPQLSQQDGRCTRCLSRHHRRHEIIKKLRCAYQNYKALGCEHYFANIPMLVVRSYQCKGSSSSSSSSSTSASAAAATPSSTNSNKLCVSKGDAVNALYMADNKWIYVKTSSEHRGYIPKKCCKPFSSVEGSEQKCNCCEAVRTSVRSQGRSTKKSSKSAKRIQLLRKEEYNEEENEELPPPPLLMNDSFHHTLKLNEKENTYMTICDSLPLPLPPESLIMQNEPEKEKQDVSSQNAPLVEQQREASSHIWPREDEIETESITNLSLFSVSDFSMGGAERSKRSSRWRSVKEQSRTSMIKRTSSSKRSSNSTCLDSKQNETLLGLLTKSKSQNRKISLAFDKIPSSFTLTMLEQSANRQYIQLCDAECGNEISKNNNM
jgi:hypothetical protein